MGRRIPPGSRRGKQKPMEKIETVVQPGQAGARLDRFLADVCGLSRSVAQQLIEEGHVLVAGRPAAKSRKLAAGERVDITVPSPRDSAILPQDIELDIVHEDEWLLVVNKPKGMVVHPAPGNPNGTLVNALLWHCAGRLSGIGGEIRPGIVHRIDKDTSGLLVVAKDDNTHRALAEQFAVHSITRVYHAVVHGHLPQATGEIDAPIGRSTQDRKKMAVTHRNAKSAKTRYSVVREYPGFTYLTLRLSTGRTHQIRVHMASIGHPLAGDTVYGPKKGLRQLGGQCLHAGTLGFVHPATGEAVEFTAGLPAYFQHFLEGLEA